MKNLEQAQLDRPVTNSQDSLFLDEVAHNKSILFSHKDIGDIDRGGICVLFKALTSGLVDRNWDVHVVTTQDFRMEGVETHRLPSIEDAREYSKSVTAVIESVNPDIVEASTWRFELLDYAKSQNRSAKVVVRADPSATALFSNVEALAAGEEEFCQNADLILAVSDFAKRDIESKYHVSDVHVVYNGIVDAKNYAINSTIHSGEVLSPATGESKALQNVPIEEIVHEGKINVMWIGKPTKMKGFDLLEKVVSAAPDNVHFIINTGYAPSEVVWNAENYERCTFIRALTKEDQLSVLRKANVFLSTSRIEGFGIAVAEALDGGLPVILNTDCEVYHEFLPNDAVGLIDINDPQSVIDSIQRNANAKTDHSRNPQKFTQQQMVEDSARYYESII